LVSVAVICACAKPTLRDEIAQENLNLGLQMGAAVDEHKARSVLESFGGWVDKYDQTQSVEGEPSLQVYCVADTVDVCLLIGCDGALSGIAVIPVYEITNNLAPGLTDVTWDKFKREIVTAARSEEVQRLDLTTERGVGLGSPRMDIILEYDQPEDEWSLSGATFMTYGDEETSLRFMLLNNVVATIQVGNRGLYRSVYSSFPSSIMARG
jgi:hypothetical protein